MNLKAIIAALEASGITRYAIEHDGSGVSQKTLSNIVSGKANRATSVQTAIKLMAYAEKHGIGPNGEKIKRKRK